MNFFPFEGCKLNYVISFSFVRGGAAIAAAKFKSLLDEFSNQETIELSQDLAGWVQFLKRLLSFGLVKLQFDNDRTKHSLNLFSYAPVLDSFKKSGSLHHIHWINNDTLSVCDFDKIPSGSIVILHDEWLYCGTEHYYKVSDASDDFINGYSFFKLGVWGVPWNAIIWHIKLKKLGKRNDLIYTVPSRWMLIRAQSSMMLKYADIRILPNPIDTDVFSPKDTKSRVLFKQKYELEETDFIFCYRAMGGQSSYLKGSLVLEKSLEILRSLLEPKISSKIKFVVFGGKHIGSFDTCGFTSHLIGHISDPCELAKVYSASDCVVVSSLVESFGQVAAEALSCETPVISFACSGLLDIVINGHTGLTAEPYCPEDLAGKLKEMVMLTIEQRSQLGVHGREHVCKHFSYSVIAEKYKKIIDDAYQLKIKKDLS
ncbi:MAG: glycosyltransferase involved in cell wall biosynthesis [Polaribacter sp.]|jgi:glycosyltransferase involved in cell wall biosynthesis